MCYSRETWSFWGYYWFLWNNHTLGSDAFLSSLSLLFITVLSFLKHTTYCESGYSPLYAYIIVDIVEIISQEDSSVPYESKYLTWVLREGERSGFTESPNPKLLSAHTIILYTNIQFHSASDMWEDRSCMRSDLANKLWMASMV